MFHPHNRWVKIIIKGSWYKMKVTNVVKTAVKFAPIVIPIIKKVIAAKKGKTPTSVKTYRK